MNTVNLKMFHNHSGIYRFVRKFDKTYEGPIGPIEILAVVIKTIEIYLYPGVLVVGLYQSH